MQKIVKTLSLMKNLAFEYIDRSLIILNQTINIHSERIRYKFLV